MGACQFKERGTGKTASEVYRKLCEIAEDEYGHQEGYNGTISTTNGFRDETEAYNKSKFNDVYAYIRDRFDSHGMNKYDCSAICVRQPVGNNNKIKTQVEHVVTPGTKKWILKYFVYSGRDTFIGAYLTKGEAVTKARAHTEKTTESTYITMEKVLDKANKTVAKITYKKATNERDGEWVFFGYAAE
jgi:hypothetical protein